MADSVSSGGADVIISKALAEHTKYEEQRIAAGVQYIQVEPTMTLPTVDSGVVNAIWIDYSGGDEE